MAKVNHESDTTTPARPLPLKKGNSSGVSDKNQRSILGFFSKAASNNTQSSTKENSKSNGTSSANNSVTVQKASLLPQRAALSKAKIQNLTPVPSSDAADVPSSQEGVVDDGLEEVDIGLPSPTTPAKSNIEQAVKGKSVADFSSPTRRVRTSF